MKALKQIDRPIEKDPTGHCGLAAVCQPDLGRRDVVRVGSWMVFLGVLGGASSLLESCSGGVNTGTATATPTGSGTPTATPSVTPSPVPTFPLNAACGCGEPSTTSGFTSLGITISDVPLNAVAYNQGNQLYVCKDSQGFYAMTSVCTHQGRDMGSSGFTSGDLSAGFRCPYHGATFSANGAVGNGTGPTPLQHYGLTSDDAGMLYVNMGQSVADTCRC